MGYYIKSYNEAKIPNEMRYSVYAWPKLLTLARSYGWEPEGTSIIFGFDECFVEDSADREKSYLLMDGQTVSAKDAAALANALENALDDIPDFQSGELVRIVKPGDDPGPGLLGTFASIVNEMGGEIITTNRDLLPFEYFSGQEKQKLINFIALCRNGAFSIW